MLHYSMEPSNMWKTVFTTIFGMLVSHVMQMGDCNTPSTFQRLMTHIFQEHIGICVQVFFDDIFIYSNTLEDHEIHLGAVFQILRDNNLYVNKEKCFLYAK